MVLHHFTCKWPPTLYPLLYVIKMIDNFETIAHFESMLDPLNEITEYNFITYLVSSVPRTSLLYSCIMSESPAAAPDSSTSQPGCEVEEHLLYHIKKSSIIFKLMDAYFKKNVAA